MNGAPGEAELTHWEFYRDLKAVPHSKHTVMISKQAGYEYNGLERERNPQKIRDPVVRISFSGFESQLDPGFFRGFLSFSKTLHSKHVQFHSHIFKHV